MKKFNLVLGAALVAAGAVSCKNDVETTAKKNVDRYVVYVDSVNNLDAAERTANWAAIEAEYEARLAEADAALANLEADAEERTKVEESKSKFDGVKTAAQSAAAPAPAEATGGDALSVAFFGPGNVVGNDMTFAWVNKDNILGVYQKFVDNFNANKDNYSRQDFDKIKAWYEALDTRKNTVEKEGLSGEDNRKIAALKLEFAPKFKWERVTAKSDENAAAKQ